LGGRYHAIASFATVKPEADMEMLPLRPERKAELDDYAKRHGQDVETALNEVLAEYFAGEKDDYQQAVEGIRRGYEDMKAGRVQSMDEFFEDLRIEHGFPG
jgi:hypothetical protein